MTRYVAHRIALTGLLFIGISAVVFFLIHAAPGDPTAFFVPGTQPDPAVRRAVAGDLGLDRPIYIQYVRWFKRAAVGDLGLSFRYQVPVLGLILERVPATVQLQLLAIAAALCVSLPLGVLSAVRSGSAFDRVSTVFTLFGISMPEFWSGLMLLLVFALQLRWLPPTGMGEDAPALERLAHYVLPATVLALTYTAWYTRFAKTSMLEVLHEDYMRTARAKGLRPRTALLRHGLRNALIPMITVVGLSLPRLLGGSIIVESIFAWPGIGRLGLEAVLKRDYPVIMGLTIFTACLVLLLNLAIDLLYVAADPRISYDTVGQ